MNEQTGQALPNGSAKPCGSLEEQLEKLKADIEQANVEKKQWADRSGVLDGQKQELEQLKGEIEGVIEKYGLARGDFIDLIDELRQYEVKLESCFETRKEELECKIEREAKTLDEEIGSKKTEQKRTEAEAIRTGQASKRCMKDLEDLQQTLADLKQKETCIRGALGALKTLRQQVHGEDEQCQSTLAYYHFLAFKKGLRAWKDVEVICDPASLRKQIESKFCEVSKKKNECVNLAVSAAVAEEAAAAAKQAHEQAASSRDQTLEQRLRKLDDRNSKCKEVA